MEREKGGIVKPKLVAHTDTFSAQELAAIEKSLAALDKKQISALSKATNKLQEAIGQYDFSKKEYTHLARSIN